MSLLHIGTELRRFGRGKLPPIALSVVMLLPLLFGGLFVWSYWDPIGHLNKLPVALVNSDKGAMIKGKHTVAGDQIVDKLIESKAVDFYQVTPDDAREGIANGTYYFAIELPTDFSEAVASANTPTPHQATLNAVFNNTNGLLGTALGNQVVTRVLATINENLGSQMVNQLLVGFGTIDQGLHKAGDGAAKLKEGSGKARDASGKLADGSKQLGDNLKTAKDGAAELDQGAQRLATNLGTADDAASQLADGLTKLTDATDKLGAGAGQISNGVNQVVGPAQTLAQTQQQLLTLLINLSGQVRGLNLPQTNQFADQIDATITTIQTNGIPATPNPDGTDPLSQLTKLANGASELHRQLTDPNADYRAGINKAADGAGQLSEGLHKLADGSQRLVLGTKKLADGTSKLAEGSEQLTSGARQLADGLVTLDDGMGELSLKLNESAQKVPAFADGAAKNFSTPVAENTPKDSLGIFGMGLTPMFISIGLFLGATVTFMLLHPRNRRAIDSGAIPLRAVLAAYLPAAIVGITQATIMFLVQRFALGLHAINELGLWASMCLIAVTFITITQGLNNIFGVTVGRVLCLALMTLQIVSSGGLYPPETQPAPLRWFHTIDPMTYSVNLLRRMIFGTEALYDHRAPQALLALIIIFTLFLTASILSAYRDRRWQMKDFRPEVSL